MTGFETGFSAQPRQATLTRMISELRTRADQAQTETVTGRPADVAKALGGRVAEAVEIDERISRLAAHGENIALAETRSEAIARSLTELRGMAVALANDATTALASGLPEGRETVSAAARAVLERAVATLNLSVAGRSLFAGDATGGPALAGADQIMAETRAALGTGSGGNAAYAALGAAFDAPGGSFDTALYQGGLGAAPRAAIAPGETISFDLRADDPALRSLIRDVSALSAAFDGSLALDDAEAGQLAQHALAGLRTGAEEIAALEGRFGATQERIALVKSRNIAEEAALSIAYNDLVGGDSYRAALEVNAIEGQLQTLFATAARLGALSLVNQIR